MLIEIDGSFNKMLKNSAIGSSTSCNKKLARLNDKITVLWLGKLSLISLREKKETVEKLWKAKTLQFMRWISSSFGSVKVYSKHWPFL